MPGDKRRATGLEPPVGDAVNSTQVSPGVRDGAAPAVWDGALENTVEANALEASATRPSLAAARATSPREPVLGEGAECFPQSIPSENEYALTLEPFGPYLRIEILAEQGSVGLVARGYNGAFGRWELLKFLRDELKEDLEVVRQFRREGRVLAQLSHPNVVQVFATYEVNQQTCLALEFLEGSSLATLVKLSSGGLSPGRTCDLLLDAVRGLAAAHEVGLLHRDVKPDNMFVVSGGRGKSEGLKLIDFGLATVDRHREDSPPDPTLMSATTGGTPLYMAPELWAGREASPRSDLYALGMSFFFVLTGRLPFDAQQVNGVRRAVMAPEPFVPLRSIRNDVPALLAAVIDRLLAKRPEDRFPSADALLGAVVSVASATRPRRVPGAGPYRGLLAFSAEERDVFFGRDRETAEICERLRTQGAVVLAGPSGSGKSSLAHAAVGPAVADGALGGGLCFDVRRVEPRGRALRALYGAVAPSLGVSPEFLATSEPSRFGERVRANLPTGRGLVLVVDQLEQLATLGLEEPDVLAFALAVTSWVEPFSPELRVVATVRADLMDRLFAIEPLRPLLRRGFFPVPPLFGAALRSALEEPARTANFRVEEPRILDDIVTEVGQSGALLPLASFAMSSWWAQRDEARGLLTTRAWKELGGVAGALSRHAERVLATLSPGERRSAATILVALVSSHGTRAVVERRQLEDLALSGAGGVRALSRLLESKLLIENDGEVELVHDSLIRHWPWLVELLSSRQEDRAFRERVSLAAGQWEDQGRVRGALWSREQAVGLLRWFAATESPLGQLELSFIDAVRHSERTRIWAGRAQLAALVASLCLAGLFAAERIRFLTTQLAFSSEEKARESSASRARLAALLARNAELELPHDPGQALRLALASRELGQRASLDVLGWKIQAVGFARPLPHHSQSTRAVAFDPGRGFLATWGEGGELHLLGIDTAGGYRVSLPPASSAALAFSPTGKFLGISAEDGALQILETQGRKLVASGRCPGHPENLVWSREDRLVAQCLDGARRSVAVLSAAGGPAAPMAEAALLAIAGDGSGILQVVEQSRLEWRDLSAPRVRTSGPLGRLPAVLGVANAESWLVGDASGSVAWLGPKSSESEGLRWVTSQHREPVQSIHPLLGGERWLTVDRGQRAVLWRRCSEPDCLAPLVALSSQPLGRDRVQSLPSRRALAVAGVDHDIVILSVDTGERLGRLALGEHEVREFSSDVDGHWLVAVTDQGEALAFDLDLATVRGIRGPQKGSQCMPAQDGSSYACLEEALTEPRLTWTLRVRPAPDDERVTAADFPISVASPPANQKFVEKNQLSSPKLRGVGMLAKTLVVESAHQELTVFREGNALLKDRPGRERVVALGRDLDLVVVGEREPGGSPVVIQVDGSRAEELYRPSEISSALSISNEGKWLAVGEAHGVVRVVELAAPSAGQSFKLPRGATVTALDWVDLNNLVAGDDQGNTFLINRSRSTVRALNSLAGGVSCLAWSKTQRGILVGSRGGELILVDTATGEGVPLFRSGGLDVCVRAGTDDRYLLTTRDGAIWQRELELAPLWTATAPEAEGEGSAHAAHGPSLQRWRGLAALAEPASG